jgi:hypothetical protein
MGPARRPAAAKALVRYSRQETFVLATRKICPANSAAIRPWEESYFQQIILGIVIIVSVALTFDRSKVSMIK